MKDRIYWIDYLKAFAMFLVVLGHSGLDNDSFLKTWIYGFHMPLFMFVSGFFAHKQKSLSSAFMKDIKSLCIPYLFFSLFLIPFYAAINHLTGVAHGNSNILVTIGQKLLMDDYYHCGPIWFLGALLVVKSAYSSVYQYIKLQGGLLLQLSVYSYYMYFAMFMFCPLIQL